MTEKIENNADELSFLIIGACLHPDEKVRKLLTIELEDWIETLQPNYTKDKIHSFLDSQNGTPLEPFSLSTSDRIILTYFIRAAFSKKINCTRILVKSADQFSDGVLLITKKLNFKYNENFVHGSKLNFYGNLWSFNARIAPKDEFLGLSEYSLKPARISFLDECLEIRLPWKGIDNYISLSRFEKETILPSINHEQLLEKTFFLSDHSRITQHGFEIEIIEEEISFRTTNPESMIRLMARISRGETLLVNQEGSSINVHVKLELPEEDSSTDLPTKFIAKKNPIPWLGANCPVINPKLSKKSREILTDYLLPYESWISS